MSTVRLLSQCKGGNRSIHDGGGGGGVRGIDVFFWVETLHSRYFFGSSDLSRIFFGLKKYANCFGFYLRANFFRFGFLLRSVDQKNIHSNFLSATCVPEKLLILRRQYNVH